MMNIFAPIANDLLSTFVNSLWLTALIGGLAWLTVRGLDTFRTLNAATRYGIWTLSLTFILSATLAVGMLSLNSIPEASRSTNGVAVAGSAAGHTTRIQTGQAGLAVAGQNTNSTARSGVDLAVSDAGAPAPDYEKPSVNGIQTPLVSSTALAPEAGFEVDGALPSSSPVQLSNVASWISIVLILIWLAGAALHFARLIWGFVEIRRLRNGAQPLDADDSEACLPEGLTRRMIVLESDEIRSPVASGPLHPAVIVPSVLRKRLSPKEFRQIVMHESAHLERRDDWTLLFQRIAEATLWFHPVVWWIAARMQDERECACDEWVVSRTRQPEAYVLSIGRLLELRLGVESMALAPGLAANRGTLVDRMRRILNERIPASSRLSGRQVALAGGIFGLIIALVFLTSSILRFTLSFDRPEEIEPQGIGAASDVESVSLRRLSSLSALPALPALEALPPLPPREPVPPIARRAPRLPVPPLQPAPSREPVAALRAGEPLSTTARAPEPLRVPLSASSWIKLLNSAAGIHSSGELHRVLRYAADRFPDNQAVYEAYIQTASSVSSSSDRQNALEALLNREQQKELPFEALISAASGISSSSERSQLLIHLAMAAPVSEAIDRSLLQAANQLSSSGDRGRVLRAISERD